MYRGIDRSIVDMDELFDDVINVEFAPYKYVETDIEIEEVELIEDESHEGP